MPVAQSRFAVMLLMALLVPAAYLLVRLIAGKRSRQAE